MRKDALINLRRKWIKISILEQIYHKGRKNYLHWKKRLADWFLVIGKIDLFLKPKCYKRKTISEISVLEILFCNYLEYAPLILCNGKKLKRTKIIRSEISSFLSTQYFLMTIIFRKTKKWPLNTRFS